MYSSAASYNRKWQNCYSTFAFPSQLHPESAESHFCHSAHTKPSPHDPFGRLQSKYYMESQ